MVLLAYGLDVPNDRLRSIADSLQGTSGYNDGIALQYLEAIGRQAGLSSEGLLDANGHFHQWSMGDVIREVRRGYPVITLVHFASLPAHAKSGSTSDHYIVVVGLTSTGFVVNDPAANQNDGYHQVLRPEEMLRAWHDASIAGQAVAFLPPTGSGSLQFLQDPAVPTATALQPTAILATSPAESTVATLTPTPTLTVTQFGAALPPPNPAMLGWSNRVSDWQRASPLPSVHANMAFGVDGVPTSGAIVLAARGGSGPSPLPLLLVLGCIAAVTGGILSVPRVTPADDDLSRRPRSRLVTVRDIRTVNRLARPEPRQLPPPR
jgi:hypothetical protein